MDMQKIFGLSKGLIMISFLLSLIGCSSNKQEMVVPFSLSSVNKTVNKQVFYTPDKNKEFKPSYDLKAGDCEDIAATKAIHLAADYALKSSQMKPLLVRVDYPNGPQKVWHMVLVVEDVDGTKYVLDNNTDKVYTLDYLYKFKNIGDNKGFNMSYTPWNTFEGGTRARAKIVQEKYEKLFSDLLNNKLV